MYRVITQPSVALKLGNSSLIVQDIRLPRELSFPSYGESELLERLATIANLNQHTMRSFIGMHM